MKKIFFILALMGMIIGARARESPEADTAWKFSGTTSLNLSQLSLTN